MSTHAVTFRVYGTPAPQGSKTRMPNGAMIEGASKGARQLHANWRSAVASAAHEHGPADGVRFADAVAVSIVFRFPLPKSRPASVRRLGMCWKASAPDVDKLLRATLDGLQAGGLLANDALAVEVHVAKIETDDWTGAELYVAPAAPADGWLRALDHQRTGALALDHDRGLG